MKIGYGNSKWVGVKSMSEFERYFAWRGLRNSLLSGVVLVLIWTLLTTYLPTGWWITLVNILCLIIIVLGVGGNIFAFFKLYIPSLLALIFSMASIFVFIMVLRTLFGAILP